MEEVTTCELSPSRSVRGPDVSSVTSCRPSGRTDRSRGPHVVSGVGPAVAGPVTPSSRPDPTVRRLLSLVSPTPLLTPVRSLHWSSVLRP